MSYDDWQKSLLSLPNAASPTSPVAGSGNQPAIPAPGILKDWLEAHGLTTGLPAPDPAYQPKIVLPGFSETHNGQALDGDEHRRCGHCHSLLPPQFWMKLDSVYRGFALTVAGRPQTGKTTWLTAMMNSPDSDSLDVLRRAPTLSAVAYDYAEPLSMRVLVEMPTRTVIPYMLLGSEVEASEGVFLVSALDIMGERFGFQEPQTKQVIQRHLKGSSAGGALLLVDKFEPTTVRGALTPARPATPRTPSPLMSIARIYEEIRHGLRKREGNRSQGPKIWSGVIWTHLDSAAWNVSAETWLRANVARLADPLIELGRLPLGTAAPFAPEWLKLVREIDARTVWDFANHFLAKLGIAFPDYEDSIKALNVPAPGGIALPDIVTTEALTSLLFRLQILYAIGANNHSNKVGYLNEGGSHYIEGVLALARALFVFWDVPRGQLNQYVRTEFDFLVLPAGRAADCNVWSDLALWQMLTAAKRTGWQ